MIGGLQVRAPYKQAVEGGRMSVREFHDTILTYGPIPIELMRAVLWNVPLSRHAGDVAFRGLSAVTRREVEVAAEKFPGGTGGSLAGVNGVS